LHREKKNESPDDPDMSEAAKRITTSPGFLWCIAPFAVPSLEAACRNFPQVINARSQKPPSIRATSTVANKIATIRLDGTLTKYGVDDDGLLFGTSTAAVGQVIDQVAADDDIAGVLLIADSSGGEANGTESLSDKLFSLRSKKPVIGFVDGLAASAAYWLLSQCTSISATGTSLVGSVGTYATVVDYSGLAEKIGIKVNVIRSAPLKGAGAPGAPVTNDQLAEFQNVVNDLNDQFIAAVARGRGIPTKTAQDNFGDAKVHVGAKAEAIGLVDHIETLDEAYARLAAAISKQPSSGDRTMSKYSNEKPATVTELKAAFPDDAEFALEAAEKAYTLLEAKAEYSDVLKGRIDAGEVKPGRRRSGPDALESAPRTAGVGAGDAEIELKTLIDARAEKIGRREKNPELARMKAYSEVKKENPDLVQQVIDEANDKTESRRKGR
jgi:signal peptide peptidase SppA